MWNGWCFLEVVELGLGWLKLRRELGLKGRTRPVHSVDRSQELVNLVMKLENLSHQLLPLDFRGFTNKLALGAQLSCIRLVKALSPD